VAAGSLACRLPVSARGPPHVSAIFQARAHCIGRSGPLEFSRFVSEWQLARWCAGCHSQPESHRMCLPASRQGSIAVDAVARLNLVVLSLSGSWLIGVPAATLQPEGHHMCLLSSRQGPIAVDAVARLNLFALSQSGSWLVLCRLPRMRATFASESMHDILVPVCAAVPRRVFCLDGRMDGPWHCHRVQRHSNEV